MSNRPTEPTNAPINVYLQIHNMSQTNWTRKQKRAYFLKESGLKSWTKFHEQ